MLNLLLFDTKVQSGLHWLFRFIGEGVTLAQTALWLDVVDPARQFAFEETCSRSLKPSGLSVPTAAAIKSSATQDKQYNNDE